MDVIKIGGKEHEVILKYVTVNIILREWSSLYFRLMTQFEKEHDRKFVPENDSLAIPHYFHFRAIWKCLKKKGFLFWKKPFKNVWHMISELRQDEVEPVITFVGDRILKLKELEPLDSKKKENRSQLKSMNTGIV